ncbi:MAG: IS3 family transposase [Gammaproteobacteria bacterium]
MESAGLVVDWLASHARHPADCELTRHRRFRTRRQAQHDIKDYIERFYNRIRLHSTLGYQPPCQYEKTAAVS